MQVILIYEEKNCTVLELQGLLLPVSHVAKAWRTILNIQDVEFS